ncbi:MAG: hypothetical protein AAGA74_16230 [Pseudomonadota bacterium]
MILPTNFHQISDYVQARWPDNCFENFGSHAFFHVVGLRDYVISHYGPISPSNVANKLISYKDEIFFANPSIVLPNGSLIKSFNALEYDGDFSSLVSPELLANIHKCSTQDIEHLDSIVEDNFYNLTLANIRNAYSDECITFSAAVLVYLAIELFATATEKPASGIQIRFAGYHIPDFDAVFAEMSLGEKLKLCAHVGDKLSQNARNNAQKNELRVFSQLASGRPVTKPFADRTADFLNDLYGQEFPDFSAQPYLLRTDITSKEKKPAYGEKTFIDFEGWAGS